MCLGGGDTAAELNVDADIAHRHFRPGKSAKNHEVVEIAEMADPEHLARDLRQTGAERQDYNGGKQHRSHRRR